jgi:hypothetical protein
VLTERIVWGTLSTVGPDNRPRSRIVHPVWDHATAPPTGYVASRPTPLRQRHLAAHPYVSVAYWSPAHDALYLDADAGWVTAPEGRRQAWDLMCRVPEPVGYDLSTIWPDGPGSADFAVIRLRPYRIRVAWAADLARGVRAPVWQRNGSSSG